MALACAILLLWDYFGNRVSFGDGWKVSLFAVLLMSSVFFLHQETKQVAAWHLPGAVFPSHGEGPGSRGQGPFWASQTSSLLPYTECKTSPPRRKTTQRNVLLKPYFDPYSGLFLPAERGQSGPAFRILWDRQIHFSFKWQRWFSLRSHAAV